MQDKLEIFIFNKARICSNANHRISFENDDDIYNPFSMKNVAFSSNQFLDMDKDIFLSLYKIAVQLDLSSRVKNTIFDGIENAFKLCMSEIVKDLIKRNAKSLLSKNIPYHCACMKFMLHLARSQTLCFLAHAFMFKYKNLLELYDIGLIDAFIK